MNEEELTLYDYVRSKNMTMEQFSVLTGISASYLYRIQRDRAANISIDKIRRIYKATEEKFGTGLTCWEYLNK